MNNHITFALFKDYASANQAIIALNEMGFNNNHISLIAQPEVLQVEQEDHSETAENAGKGAGIGGVAGLIAGLAPIAIPGVGPIISAGSLIGGAISGAGIGSAIGSLVGLFKTWFGETEAQKMEEEINEGNILLAVQSSKAAHPNVQQTLEQYGAYEMHERKAQENITA